MSRRQDLVDAVKARFEGILVANGYNTDLGEHVHEWLSRELSKPDELPALAFRDGEARPILEGDKDAERYKWELAFEIDLIFSEGDATASDARQGIADVYRAIGEDPNWTVESEQLAARTVPVSDRVMTDDQGNWLGGARVEFKIEFYTDAWGAS